MNNDNINPNGLSYTRLTAVAIGATIGGGVFSLSGDMAANGANTGAVLVGWLICCIGMLSLMMCFYGLNKLRPDLTGGIYSYAKEGYGEFIGFNSAWGYWISALLANVSYATLLFAAIAYFFPIFGEGNNIISIICASVIIWLMNFLVLKGVKEAAGVNLVITIAKIMPIIVFILAIIFLSKFKLDVFLQNFWGEANGLSFLDQVKATTGTTVWAFIGIEGAVVISGRAKRSKDVGRATVTAFVCVFLIYLMVSTLSMGVMPRAELAALKNPPMAGILSYALGPIGAIIVNLGVIISLTGATLGYTIIAAECPYEAAKQGVFMKLFAKTNKNGAPSASLFITNSIIQLFLIIIYFNQSTYQIFYTISASMIMFPYLLSALFYLKYLRKSTKQLDSMKMNKNLSLVFAVIGSIYGLWLLYSTGLVGILISALLYAPGIIVYILGKKERNEKYLAKTSDKILAFIIVSLAILSLILILTGQISPF
jgi:arginine:ornithine antiporter/lysine permease